MRNSFVMYKDWREMVETMDNESRGELLLAIMRYQDGADIKFKDSSPAAIAFAAMKPQFDKDREKYEESMKRRSEAGKVAAQARKEKSNRNESQRIATSKKQSLHDNVDVNDNDKKESTLSGTKEKRFAPPTPDQVREYCAEKGYAVDADRFCDFYASKNWMVGKNKMKDWKAAVRNWARSEKEERQEKATKPNKFNNFSNDSYGDIDELERKLLMEG